jgi:hypothetical protein
MSSALAISNSWLTFGIFVRHDLVVEIGITTMFSSGIHKSIVKIHKISLPISHVE